MVGLPNETHEDIVNTVNFINTLNYQGIKIHSTYIEKDTGLYELYKMGKYTPITYESYMEELINILTHISSDVIVHAINFYKEKGVEYDVVVLLQPTSPFRRVDDVKGCLELYDDSLDMVTSVKESYVSAVLCHEDEKGYLVDTLSNGATRRQDAAKYYEYNGAVYVINAKAVIEKGLGGFNKIRKYVMPEINSLDIDVMTDWYIAESLLEKKVIEL